MTENKMYSDRIKNIAAFRGCKFACVYCEDSFQRLIKMNKKCPDCSIFNPHSHMEVLQRTPPKTKPGEFLTVGLSGDVAFCSHDDLVKISSYCAGWSDRTFLFQSKNPAVFLEHYWSDNVIIGTTIETNRTVRIWGEGSIVGTHNDNYSQISKAPSPYLRTEAMVQLSCKKAVTIEPILDFDMSEILYWMKRIAPVFVYIGYCNDGKQGKRLKLPEPSLAKTLGLINALEIAGIDVRRKTLRPAWYETELYEPCLQCGTLRLRQTRDSDSLFCTLKCKNEYKEHEQGCSVCCEGGEEE